jgi:hypothetical protein
VGHYINPEEYTVIMHPEFIHHFEMRMLRKGNGFLIRKKVFGTRWEEEQSEHQAA